ncbi:MAG: GntR family transcriptional regulator [Janthinobacterium lividum]
MLEKLRGAIVQGHFRSRDRLVERALYDRLGINRTMVREMMQHLENADPVKTQASRRPRSKTRKRSSRTTSCDRSRRACPLPPPKGKRFLRRYTMRGVVASVGSCLVGRPDCALPP